MLANRCLSAIAAMMKILFLLFSIAMSATAGAEVFKCLSSSGKIAYQDKPCEPDARQEKVQIEPIDPRESAEAEERFKAWEIDYEQRRAARLQAEQAQREERARLEAVEALKQSAEAQRRQAEAELRQAEALENRYRTPTYPLFYIPHQSRPPSRDRRRDLKEPSKRTRRNPIPDRDERNRRR